MRRQNNYACCLCAVQAMAADLMQLNEVINHATSGSIIIINPEAALLNANTNPLMRTVVCAGLHGTVSLSLTV